MPKFMKGSEEMKAHMAKLRSMRVPKEKKLKRVGNYKSKYAKGSEEMKAHMAALRAMKKK